MEQLQYRLFRMSYGTGKEAKGFILPFEHDLGDHESSALLFVINIVSTSKIYNYTKTSLKLLRTVGKEK